jgi:hypothetical protein
MVVSQPTALPALDDLPDGHRERLKWFADNGDCPDFG